MLFNTLAYAKFFGIVFLVSWLLVRRKLAVWVPWIGLAAFVAFGPALQGDNQALGISVIAYALTWALSRSQGERRSPTRDAAVSSPAAPAPMTTATASAEYGGAPPTPATARPADSAPSTRALAASAAINTIALAWLLYDAGQANLVSATFRGLGVPLADAAWSKTSLAHSVGALVCAAAMFALLRAKRVRLLFVLGASYVFYAHWDYRFLPLIFGSSTIDFWLGRKIGETEDPKERRKWLTFTVLVNLGVLSIFKYLGFGIDSATLALEALGFDVARSTLEIALPVGISFFTFESMSYVIDVYRRELPPHRSYLEYLSFVAFFPHLVAGPIVRPRDLLPQLGGPPRWSSSEGSEGLYLIAWGLLKKVAISDYLALNLVDRVFDAPTQYSSLECYAAVVSYAVQIYCDFSGYTDVAIGSALLLGVRFPLNFDAPYKAHNIQDFWRRWHISLSTWLRDYLYIPLGGNRLGTARTYINLMLTMLLGGLWHGASWTFVLWGGLHGGALALHRAWGSRAPPNPQTARHWVGVALTFHFVCLAWIFFRAETFTKAWAILTQITQGTVFHPNLDWKVLAILAVGLVTHLLPERWYQTSQRRFIELPALAQGVVLCLAALALREMLSAEAVPFVYFQF